MTMITGMAATSLRLDGEINDLLTQIARREYRTKKGAASVAIKAYALASLRNHEDVSHAITPCDDTALEVGSLDIPPASVAAEAGGLRHAG